MKSFIFFAFLVILSVASADLLKKELRKQLAGPPSEFGKHDLPTPAANSQNENSAYFQSQLKTSKSDKRDSLYADFQLNVDSASNFTFSVVSKHVELLQLTLSDPNGKNVDLSSLLIKDEFPIGDHQIPTLVYQFANPIIGLWDLKVFIPRSSLDNARFESIATEDGPNVAVLLFNHNGAEIFTHLSSYFTHTGTEVGLIAMSVDKDVSGSRRVMKTNSLIATMDVTLPDGKRVEVMMNDEGRGLDRVPGDGIFAGSISASENGNYKMKAEIKGTDGAGKEFVRTSQHLINVVDQTIKLTGSAYSKVDEKNNQRLEIQIGVNTVSSKRADNKLFRAYAEVYGTDSAGSQVPVCWIGGMTSVETSNGNLVVPLSLDLNWAALAKAKAPFQLKNIYVSDPISQVPEDFSSFIPVEVSSSVQSHISSLSLVPTSITKEMKQGRMPESFKARVGGKSGLILVHGYCAGTNPWESTKDIWTNPYYFLDANASITNEEYAQKIVNFAESNGLDSYSIIGHSQGGQVATHILNYYFSGMDNLDSSKRLVQSVGTPYGGSASAGTAASIGTVVGIGCGSNFDLTHDGSALWQSGIASDARSAVHYYTTTYEQGHFFGDSCSLPMNLILDWPNDGVTELEFAHLEGGVFEGNTEKQCHTTDMNYPAQYKDRARNTIMNAKAASN